LKQKIEFYQLKKSKKNAFDKMMGICQEKSLPQRPLNKFAPPPQKPSNSY
jgi:hypothetical protein